jgi:hypothetical protein
MVDLATSSQVNSDHIFATSKEVARIANVSCSKPKGGKASSIENPAEWADSIKLASIVARSAQDSQFAGDGLRSICIGKIDYKSAYEQIAYNDASKDRNIFRVFFPDPVPNDWDHELPAPSGMWRYFQSDRLASGNSGKSLRRAEVVFPLFTVCSSVSYHRLEN